VYRGSIIVNSSWGAAEEVGHELVTKVPTALSRAKR
jgi:hypothetical protein